VPTLAATATPAPGALALLILALIVVTVGYALACWLYPVIPCRRCSGSGKRRAILGGRTFGLCRRCDGTGRQLRPGRRVINYLRGLHDKADR
jgi:hypothetical protein